MPQLLDPPTTEAALRERAEELAHDVEGRLEPASAGSEDAEARVAARQTFFDELRTTILSIAQSPAWRAHDLARDLLVDRKSTRLNSSHANISYAVFCLKKKKT